MNICLSNSRHIGFFHAFSDISPRHRDAVQQPRLEKFCIWKLPEFRWCLPILGRTTAHPSDLLTTIESIHNDGHCDTIKTANESQNLGLHVRGARLGKDHIKLIEYRRLVFLGRLSIQHDLKIVRGPLANGLPRVIAFVNLHFLLVIEDLNVEFLQSVW